MLLPPDFDYQWKNLPSVNIEYNKNRVKEFLGFTGFKKALFGGCKEIQDKVCLDAGCGSGRYTFALMQLGAAKVDSIDISPEAIEKCKQVNPNARVQSLLELEPSSEYDFVLCWGVLNHVPDARAGFARVAPQVKPGGKLHIMVYHKDTQANYIEGRKNWALMSHEQRITLCNEMISKHGGDLHGWWDAFNPTYNHSFYPDEVLQWFKDENFTDIRLVTGANGRASININAIKL
jgi:2-polyprenyl-3-methyl-5-hydroxy-6-metoxy-1,4-benzoquinol methylase